MIDFLKARGESEKRLGPMNFMNLQALYIKVKKEEEEKLGKKGSKKRVINQEEDRKPKKPKPSPTSTTSSIQQPSTLHPRPPFSPPTKIMELGEAHEPENEGGRHLLMVIKHHFNPIKDEIIDVKPLQSHSPFISWSYNAEKDEFTLTDVKGQKMRCSSKAIFKMASKDIKTLSELPLNNPSKDQRGYEVERIVSNMQKLQQQKQ
ncbi:hypothetical protein L1987_43586 [Smallanthus sonchifolius]|uniref:Uncharacterized protein n=1 Tax=Smallanthus sonchifolius TaxID=185202 RepID=A0ACB9GM66_9ASTR|nr:hypothetical protein L1987_43586 [Smallanthus sonchifolius]